MLPYDQAISNMRTCLAQAAEQRSKLAAHLDILREAGVDTTETRGYIVDMDQMLAVMHEQLNISAFDPVSYAGQFRYHA